MPPKSNIPDVIARHGQEIATRRARGESNEAIARSLGLSYYTVRSANIEMAQGRSASDLVAALRDEDERTDDTDDLDGVAIATVATNTQSTLWRLGCLAAERIHAAPDQP